MRAKDASQTPERCLPVGLSPRAGNVLQIIEHLVDALTTQSAASVPDNHVLFPRHSSTACNEESNSAIQLNTLAPDTRSKDQLVI